MSERMSERMSAQTPITRAALWEAFHMLALSLRAQTEAFIAFTDAMRAAEGAEGAEEAPVAETQAAAPPAAPEPPDVQPFFGRARARREAAAHSPHVAGAPNESQA